MASFLGIFKPKRAAATSDCAVALVAVARSKRERKIEKVGCLLSTITRKLNDLHA